MKDRKKELPEDNAYLICSCPDWCESGYQIAFFKDGEFQYQEQPNADFDKHVTGWKYLNID